MNDHFTKGGEMKGVLVIIAVLVFASAGMAAEYFKWIDKRGVVHFTDTEASVPEKKREDMERRDFPKERETSSESTREAQEVTEEPRDRFGRGRDFWVNWTNEAKNRLYRAEREYERLRKESRYKKRMESVQVEMKRRREDIRKAREELEITLPRAAERAGAPQEWVR
jgi:hypothetical protein